MGLQQVLFDMLRPFVSRWQMQPKSIVNSGAATTSRGLTMEDASTLLAATDGMSLEDVMKEMRSIREQEESRKDEVRSLREQLCRATSEQKRHYAEASNNVQKMASELRAEMEQLRASSAGAGAIKDGSKSKKGGASKSSSEAVSREDDAGLTADVAALREMLEETRQELKDAERRVEDSTAQVATLHKTLDAGVNGLQRDLAAESSERGAEAAKLRKRIETANSTALRAETAAAAMTPGSPVQAVDREDSPISRPVDRGALNDVKSELTTRMKRLDKRVDSLENTSKDLVESVEDTMRETKAKLDARLETSLGGSRGLAGLSKQNEEFAVQLKKLKENDDLTELKADMKKVTAELERKINKKEAPTMTQFKEHASSLERKLAFLATKSKQQQQQTAQTNQQPQGTYGGSAAVPNAPGQWSDQHQMVWCVPYMDGGYGYNENGEPVMYDWWQDNTASTGSHPEAKIEDADAEAGSKSANALLTALNPNDSTMADAKGEGTVESSPREPEPETTATSAEAAAPPVKSTEAEASTEPSKEKEEKSTEAVGSLPTSEKASTKPSKNKKKRKESRSPTAAKKP